MDCRNNLRPGVQDCSNSNSLSVSTFKKARYCPYGSSLRRPRRQAISTSDFKDLMRERAKMLLSFLPAPYARPPKSQQSTPMTFHETDFTFLTFIDKLWNIVESDLFLSAWWTVDGTAIVIDKASFKKEILERNGPRIFASRNLKHFHRQLYVRGFNSRAGPDHENMVQCDTVHGIKLQMFSSPYFQRGHGCLLAHFDGKKVDLPAVDGRAKGAGCGGVAGGTVSGPPVSGPQPCRPCTSSSHPRSFPAILERVTPCHTGESPVQFSGEESSCSTEESSLIQVLQSYIHVENKHQLNRVPSPDVSL